MSDRDRSAATHAATAGLRNLAMRISGAVALPGDDGSDAARSSWNLAVDLRPIAVVHPESVADVVATVRLAASDGLKIAFCGGGHNTGTLDWDEPTILLKTERMRGIEIDAASRRPGGVCSCPLRSSDGSGQRTERTDVRATGVLIGLWIAAVLSGCGGGNGGASPTPAGQTAAADLPPYLSAFDRVCETQIGFGGAAAYAPTPGIHPVILFADYRDPPTLIESGLTLPAGWTVAEVADVELVACSRRTELTPTGTKCDFGGNDGSAPITLELADTVYELTVYAAATGDQVGEPQSLEGSTTECPMFATFREGDTQYLINPSEDQYLNALKGFVAPES
jgi:hypothetical protein